jgi:hypothetical protein
LNRKCTLPNASTEVHAAERVDRTLGHVRDLVALGHVHPQGQRLAAVVVDQGRGLACPGLIDVGAHDIGVLAREDERGGAADTARRAGDDDGLADEVVRCLRHE